MINLFLIKININLNLKIIWHLNKGSFYHEKIFDIYDEFIEKEGENIMNKIIGNYIEKLHIYTTQITNNEINNINGK